MKRRPIFALVAGAALILGSLISAAPAVAQKVSTSSWMDAMHDSPAMVQMRDRMPADLQQKCDQMHDQMTQWLDQHPDVVPTVPGGMMSPGQSPGPNGMMGSGGMMTWKT